MSQRYVEQLVGKLVTDEGFRRSFFADPPRVLEELVAAGWELTGCERHALATTTPAVVERCAAGLDPRIQKCELVAVHPSAAVSHG